MKTWAHEERVPSSVNRQTTLVHEKEPVVSVDTSVFQFAGKHLPLKTRRINAHYRFLNTLLQRRSKKGLYRRAAKQHKSEGKEAKGPIRVAVGHQVTWYDGRLLSLYHDRTESDGANREAVCRMSDTWDLSDGFPVSLRNLCGKAMAKRKLPALAIQEFGRRYAQGDPVAAPLKRKLRRYFDKDQFYLTPEGLVVFWSPMTVLPARYGCPIVSIPYEKLGMTLPENGEPERASAPPPVPAKKGKLFG